MQDASSLHPVFANILASFEVGRDMIERAEYEKALRQFDWHYSFSDDAEVYHRGRAGLEALRAHQQRIDPQGVIWRSIAPQGHSIPGPVVAS